MAITLETLALQIEVNNQELTAGLGKAGKQVDKFTKRTEKSFKLLKVAALGIFGSQFIRSVVNAASAMQQLEARLKTSTGSAMAAGEAMNFLNSMAQRQSVDLLSLADGYTRLLPSVKSGAITMQEMRTILGLVNDNMRAFGASAEDAKFIFFGLSQLLGSGIVTMENLKQVTERLPGSLEALAKATGKPLGVLIDWVSTGKVTAQMLKGPLLQAFRINEGAAEDLGNTYSATVTRMVNSFRKLSSTLGESGILDSLTFMIDTVTKLSDAIQRIEPSDEVKRTITFFANLNIPVLILRKGIVALNEGLTEQAIAADKAAAALERQLDVMERLGKIGPRDIFFGGQGDAESFIGPLGRRNLKEQGETEDLGFVPTPTEKPEKEAMKALEDRLQEVEDIEEMFRQRKLDREADFQQSVRDLIDDSQNEITNKTKLFNDRLELIEELSGEAKFRATVFAFKDLLGEAAKHNKTLFDINKAAGIANAVISTAQGVAKALELPFPLNLAAAATVAAAGAAQIATISSQQFQGGKGGGGGGGGASSIPTAATAQDTGGGGGETAGQTISIQGVDRGSLFTGNQVNELLKALNDAIEDGATLKGISVV